MSTLVVPKERLRRRIRVTGVVQGVGFRPFVHHLANSLDLAGFVGNDSAGVLVEVEGLRADVERFEQALVLDAPPLARIRAVEAVGIAPRLERGFLIVESEGRGPSRTLVCPDVAVCDQCLVELADPADRRYRYPFTNCTNCGPRFTITVALPYDRPNTTMAGFAMCPACAAEYHDPADRRFHAQPVACPACGPQVTFSDAGGSVRGTDAALAAAQRALAHGQVVAIKGLGGFHLACDARSVAAVGGLRWRKHRPDKPLAVMVADLEAAQRLAHVSRAEACILKSPAAPIVLMARRTPAAVAGLVAPGCPHLGVMLAYTPLHRLLFWPVPDHRAPVPEVLVMTSGNLSDEPICFEEDEARRRLGSIADAWLVHDRPIHVPCDDSVVRVDDNGTEVPVRRSRGYAPLPVRLPFCVPPTLAAGGELKNTFCVAGGHDAWLSQHIGDMGSLETLRAFARSAGQFEDFYQVCPEAVAADAHPGYQTRRWAEAAAAPIELVQHHHAHVAALMAEHETPSGERVIGVAFDGTGYGDDGAIWGGEVLLASYGDYERLAHLAYAAMPGGDATIAKPYRAALAHLFAADLEWADDLAPVQAAPDHALAVLRRQLERGVGCVATSSMGRLFDAVSSILGVRHEVSYEGQAAIELEAVAAVYRGSPRSYAFGLTGDQIEAGPVLAAILADLRAGWPRDAIAAGFHRSVARAVAVTAERLGRETGISRVALTGGVFQNMLLTQLARAELEARGLAVLSHHLVPPNDGGLALGQAAVAGYRRGQGGPP